MNNEPRNLVLTGFMGTGKSTVAALASEKLGLPLLDIDAEIEQRCGMTVQDVFRTLGEPAFRRLEGETCAAAARTRGQVIATGGGALINADNLAAMMHSGVVVCLWADVADLRRRLAADPTRPLAGDWEALLAQRRPAYEAMPHHIQTAGKTAAQVAEEVIAIWREYSG